MSKYFIFNRFNILALSFVVLSAFFSIPQRLVETSAKSDAADGTAQGLVRYRENFDNVQTPQLPSGWTRSATGAGVNFVTVSNNSDTPPNAIFTPNPTAVGLAEITSPPILIAGIRNVLSFRHKYAVENTWDGGVLEIKIGTEDFQDVISAGGAFIAGGYTTLLNNSANPLANRQAWSGGTEGFITTSVELPARAFGETVQFRWRFGTNESFGNDGWWIDTIMLESIPNGANTGAIVIPDSGTAAPYPSSIQISQMSGFVTGVSVSIENFSHSAPDDVDILLVAPNGRRIVLMSDVGGNTAINGLTLTFSASAATALPDNSPLTSGIFLPTNVDNADNFPAPAPQGAPTGNTFEALYGTNPNGIWSLYVVDDSGANAGTIAGGWGINLQTSVSACLFDISPAIQAFPITGGSGSFQISAPPQCAWSVSTNYSFITINSPIEGIGDGTVNFTVAANMEGGRTGTIQVSDGFNIRTFSVQQPSGCPFSLAQTSLSFSAAGGNGSVAVTAGGNCSWQAISSANWIEVSSQSQTGNGTAVFNVLPNTTRLARSATLTIGARTVNISQAGLSAARFDFDGDGKSDISVYRNGTWFLQRSTAGFAAAMFGNPTDRIAPADFDGDGKTDLSVFRQGFWYRINSSNNQFAAFQFGSAGDIPVAGDFDADGIADISVFRPSNGYWYRLNSSNNQVIAFQWGAPGDLPQIADFDGDGKSDYAVFRPANGIWFIAQSSDNSQRAINFGASGDIPISADYDGDGKADVAVFRSSEGVWYRVNSSNNQPIAEQFGVSEDKAVPADYDGDGRADIAVFRPSSGFWFIRRSSSGFWAQQFGASGDIPVAAFSIQ